jgi:hypothetical protein
MSLPGAKTIREVAIERLCNWLDAMERGVADDGTTGGPEEYEFVVDEVVRVPLDPKQYGHRKGLMLAVLEEDEITQAGVGIGNFQPRLTVRIAWRSAFLAGVNDDPAEVNNRILGNIQRRVAANQQLATTFGGADGIVTNMIQQGSALNYDSYLDRQLEGEVVYLMQYKYLEDDPRRRVPGAAFLPDPAL